MIEFRMSNAAVADFGAFSGIALTGNQEPAR